jgi:hypothetical protein
MCCLHLQGRSVSRTMKQQKNSASCLHGLVFGSEDGGCTFRQKCANVYQTARHKISEDSHSKDNLNSNRRSDDVQLLREDDRWKNLKLKTSQNITNSNIPNINYISNGYRCPIQRSQWPSTLHKVT